VYGLGAVAYHALTGVPPVEPEEDTIRTGDIAVPSEIAPLPQSLDHRCCVHSKRTRVTGTVRRWISVES